jgi:nucleotide-binding universal stress UspA family protein
VDDELNRAGCGRPAAIVVGVDGSQSSLRAAAYAVGLARRQHACLVLVYARAQPGGLVAVMDYGGTATATVVDAEDDIEADLVDAIRRGPSDVEARLVVRYGPPVVVLSQVAHEVQAGAVIVGRSESFAHRIAGSVPSQLVRSGRWPITIVP